MRFTSILYCTAAIASLLTQAIPVPDNAANALVERAPARARVPVKPAVKPVVKKKTTPRPVTAVAKPVKKPVAKKTAVKAVTKKPAVKAVTKKPAVKAVPKTSTVKAAPKPAVAKPAAKTAPVPATKQPAAAKKPTSTTSSTKAAAAKPTSCPLYLAADRVDISRREVEILEKRVGEEYWFRFDDPSIAKGGAFLTLAARPGGKDFDDQAYKWISTDVSKVTRGSIKGRVPTVYVLPAGTRNELLAKAQEFETVKDKKQRVDFVKKANEPGDIGIQGVTPSADGVALPLDDFRAKVLRVVTKVTSTKAGNKATFTTINGKTKKAASGASKADQKALEKFC